MKLVLIHLVLFWVAFAQANTHHSHPIKPIGKPVLPNFSKLVAENEQTKSNDQVLSFFERKVKKQEPEPENKGPPEPMMANDGRPPLTEFQSSKIETTEREPINKLQEIANRTIEGNVYCYTFI
jgi:hypothetical protein